MYDREDYRDLLERQGKEKKNGTVQNLEYLVQAQVRMDLLTGDPNWDRFLSYLEASVEAMHGILAGLERKICDPATFDPSEVQELKLSIARMMGRIEAVEAVIGLPKDIRESGERARNRLRELESGLQKFD